MKISIQEMIGKRCIIRDDGQKVYDQIHDALVNGSDVTLDFSDVVQIASPFFNFAVGQLLKDIKVEDLRSLLHLENLNETGQQIVDRVLENASTYYSDTSQRQIVDDILEQQAVESD